LADPTRFRILDSLAHEDLCVCDLAELAGVSQSGVSHQLRLLRDRGLVTFRRDGQRAVYRLADEHVRDLIAIGVEHATEVRE
jgi:DNA-binding transcriptional ArsR family regulator